MRPGTCTAGASPCLVIVTERSAVMPNLLLAWLDYLRRSHGFPVGAGGHRGQRSCMTPANQTRRITATCHRAGAELTRPRGKITTKFRTSRVPAQPPPHRSPRRARRLPAPGPFRRGAIWRSGLSGADALLDPLAQFLVHVPEVPEGALEDGLGHAREQRSHDVADQPVPR